MSVIMKSLRSMTLLLIAGLLVRASPFEKHPELPQIGLDKNSTEPQFDAEQYKLYLSTLTCPQIQNLNDGYRVREVATGSIYDSPASSSSIEVPTTTRTKRASQVLTSTQPATKPPQNNPYHFEEYIEDINKKNEKSQHGISPRQDNNSTGDKVAPFKGYPSRLTLVDHDSGSVVNNTVEECTAPLTSEWTLYNWYQVLVNNGGPPGAFLQKGAKASLTKVQNPCARPLSSALPVQAETTYIFTHAEFEKVYRNEQAQIRFPGTPHEFIDVTGQLVWSPPESPKRYFHFSYHKDDTGLYFKLERQRCVFKKEFHVRLECIHTGTDLICDCYNGKERCYEPGVPAAGIPSGLQASLIG